MCNTICAVPLMKKNLGFSSLALSQIGRCGGKKNKKRLWFLKCKKKLEKGEMC